MGVDKVDLLFFDTLILAIKELNLTERQTKYGAFISKVKVYGSIQTLDSILNKQGYLNMFVLEELIKLLSNDHVVVCFEREECMSFELVDSIVDLSFHRGSFD